MFPLAPINFSKDANDYKSYASEQRLAAARGLEGYIEDDYSCLDWVLMEWTTECPYLIERKKVLRYCHANDIPVIIHDIKRGLLRRDEDRWG